MCNDIKTWEVAAIHNLGSDMLSIHGRPPLDPSTSNNNLIPDSHDPGFPTAKASCTTCKNTNHFWMDGFQFINLILSLYHHMNWTDDCYFTWIINMHSPRNIVVFPIICVPRMFLKFQTYLILIHWTMICIYKIYKRSMNLLMQYEFSKLYPKTQKEVAINSPMMRIGL